MRLNEAVARVATDLRSEPDERQRRIDAFTLVRDLPYSTQHAHDAASLLALGRGDCLAKSDLLKQIMDALGHRARFVYWPYRLPEQPAEIELLRSRQDIHRAVEVLLGDRWRLLDATHDPSLGAVLAVAEWDGDGDCAPAYEPTGPILREGIDDAEIERVGTIVMQAHEGATDDDFDRYRAAFNAWLDQVRRSGVNTRGTTDARSSFPSLFTPWEAVWGTRRVWGEFSCDPPPEDLIGNVRVVPFIGDDVVVVTSVEYGPMILGGTLEPDETPMQTISREALEEAGADLRSFVPFGSVHLRTDAPSPYRPHLPHPEWYWLVGYGDVEIVGSPSTAADAEQILAVEILAPEVAEQRFRDHGDAWSAELLRYAAWQRVQA